MSKPRTLPEPEQGWPRGCTRVTVKRLTPPGDTYAVDAVSLNGYEPYGPDVVGYLVGRYDHLGGKREWDYVIGTREQAESGDVQSGLVYPTRSRQTAAGALVEALQRVGAARWSAATPEEIADVVKAAQVAHTLGAPRAPAASPIVQDLLNGRPVGEPRTRHLMEAFTDEYDRLVDAAAAVYVTTTCLLHDREVCAECGLTPRRDREWDSFVDSR